MNLVAYYRVSTAKQGQSGLGIEAQRAAVNAFAKVGHIIEEFLDIESGKNDDRPQLLKAIEFAKNRQKAQDNLNNQRVCALIKELRANSKTYRMIADVLNKNGFCSSRGGAFTATQVMRLCALCHHA